MTADIADLDIAEPGLGDPLPIQASPETLRLLARRRSSSSQLLGLPGPDRDETARLLRLGMRVPDHGKLAPWRFVVLEPGPKAVLVDRLRALAARRPDAESATAKLGKLAAAPLTIAVVSQVDPLASIPAWEQELSAGAVCMTLLIAATAMGYGCNWITDWYSYDREALALLGVDPDERIAGFVHVGTPPDPPLERVRPEPQSRVTYWAG